MNESYLNMKKLLNIMLLKVNSSAFSLLAVPIKGAGAYELSEVEFHDNPNYVITCRAE